MFCYFGGINHSQKTSAQKDQLLEKRQAGELINKRCLTFYLDYSEDIIIHGLLTRHQHFIFNVKVIMNNGAQLICCLYFGA